MANEKYVEFSLSGRLVQGGLQLRGKVDDDGNPVMEKEDPTKQVMESFIALAIHKSDPQASYIRQLLTQVAARDYPGMITGECQSTHPRFAFKIQDGDSVDANGKSVADKPGFAGHWIVKMNTRMQPKCFLAGKYAPHEQLQSPDDVIKKGYYIRVVGSVRDNGVPAQGKGSAVPGLFVTHQLVELIAPGEEIITGINASEAFGKLGAAALPTGAVVNQTIAANMPTPPGSGVVPQVPVPAIGVPQPPQVGMPQVPAVPVVPVVPQPPAVVTVPVPPAAPAGPVVSPQLVAQGVTWAALQGQGWTEDAARAAGHIL